jgi:hypothetical protein
MVSKAQLRGSGSSRADQVRALACLKEALELLDKSRAPPEVRARLHDSIEALSASLKDHQ